MNLLPSKIFLTLVALTVLVGCNPRQPLYLNDTGNLNYYVEQATDIEYPDAVYPSLEEVTQSLAPVTVMNPDFQAYEDISLEDAVSYAMLNAKVLRGYGTPALQGSRVSPGQDSLTNNPLAAGTTYNVAIRETEPGFVTTPGQIANPSGLLTNTSLDGNQGVEAALADFDAQWTSSINWAKSDEPRNGPSILNSDVFQQDQVTWQTELAKKAANGTQIFFRNINQWTENNNPGPPLGVQQIDSFYRASFEAEIRQPLLRGRGTFINRMPIVISRISSDQELANLEANLQNYVTNVEIRYWDLYCAYRSFAAAKVGFNAALETSRIVEDQYSEGAEVNIQQVAQAREQYHFFNAQVVEAKSNLLNAEGQLRYLLGWATTDGRLLRPTDEPFMSPIEFDWCTTLCEAMTYRPELRQQRWEVKKRELAVHYAKNGLLPQLDVSMLYRWLGLGNFYGTSSNSTPFPTNGSGALNELYGGNFQEFNFGLNFGVPVGFRRELANVRNAQLKQARELARIEDMELDVTRELAEAFRALDTNLYIIQESFNRWKNTVIEEEHFQRLEDAGTEALDVALDAQRRRSQAEEAFHRAVCEYNKVIALIHRRKGTILAYSGIEFQEGPWAGKAYLDAQEHARRRGASREINYGWSRPEVISRGENWPTANNVGMTPTAQTKGVYPENKVIVPITEIFEPGISPELNGNRGLPGMLMDGVNGSPTPIETGSGARYIPNQPDQMVRQATYVVAETPTTTAPSTNQNQVRIRAQKPVRDHSAMPVQRIQANPNVAMPQKKSTAVLRPGNLDWKKFGMEIPNQSLPQNSAKIKYNP
ncbi:MAG: TolC family protein [Planctomycetota bacterium]